MQWKKRENDETVCRGSIVKIRVKGVFHYGVYVGNETVVQFGSADMLPCPDPASVCVSACSLAEFCGERTLFVGIVTPDDPPPLAPETVCIRALSRIGERGYDFVRNNCEHFVCECVFDRPIAPETERFSALFERMPNVTVCLAKIPFKKNDSDSSGIFPTERRREIEAQKNPHVRCQKYFSWRLLEYTAFSSYGIRLRDAKIRKEASGKWVADGFCFSLSHSGTLVAAAVSNRPVGIDVEGFCPERFSEKLARHILTDREKTERDTLFPARQPLFTACAWTGKESTFKRIGEETGTFRPNRIEAFDNTSFYSIRADDSPYILSVSASQNARVHLVPYDHVEIEKIVADKKLLFRIEKEMKNNK